MPEAPSLLHANWLDVLQKAADSQVNFSWGSSSFTLEIRNPAGCREGTSELAGSSSPPRRGTEIITCRFSNRYLPTLDLIRRLTNIEWALPILGIDKHSGKPVFQAIAESVTTEPSGREFWPHKEKLLGLKDSASPTLSRVPLETSWGDFSAQSEATSSYLDWLTREDDEFAPDLERLKSLDAIYVGRATLQTTSYRLPLAFHSNRPTPLGVYLRNMTMPEANVAPKSKRSALTLDDLDVISVTTSRFSSVRELAKSIRAVLGPKPNLIVAVQAPKSVRWRALARKYNFTLLHLSRDTGLSESRNQAVAMTSRKLILLTDDDFQLDGRSRITDALQILDERPDISVLGGNLLDVLHWNDSKDREVPQSFAMKMVKGPPDIAWLRVEDTVRNREYLNPRDYVEFCDIVDNFAIFRAEVLRERVRWNPNLKIGAEHQDLYIRLLSLGDVRVARTNSLKVRNVRVQNPRFRKLRRRTDDFFPIFFRDLDLSSFLILGERQRIQANSELAVLVEKRGWRVSFIESAGR